MLKNEYVTKKYQGKAKTICEAGSGCNVENIKLKKAS